MLSYIELINKINLLLIKDLEINLNEKRVKYLVQGSKFNKINCQSQLKNYSS